MTGCISGTFEMCTRTCGAPGQIACNTATGRYDGACEPIEGIECPTTEPRCTADTYRACTLTCGRTGQIACNTATGLYDGACLPFAGYECPAPSADAGPTGSSDAGVDAYVAPATDAGSDAGVATTTVDLAFTMDPSLYVAGSMAISEEMAATGATHANAVRLACGGATTTSGTVWYHCLVTRPVGSDLYFVGTFTAHYSRDLSWTEGQILATASGYGRTTCGDGSVTRGIAWAISAADGHSLLPSTGVPETVQPRGITEDGYPVCRHHIVF
ncbi:MAG TPA: hypothetical protein VMU11_02820 [Verrucomicrobiae bacterium]|nr:hypothetical protein [Verrucomicrobiae bacterium]